MLSANGELRTVKNFSSKDIVDKYCRYLDIDVSRFFSDVETIELIEDVKTGYKFYQPNGIEGDSRFYEELEKFEWYYMPWKWEHEYVMLLLKDKDVILEVGSGGLGFVEKLHANGYDVSGLELNEKSLVKASSLNLKVYRDSIQEYAINNCNKYDIVCSFQVLEHIADVRSFIKAKVDCLKVGGKLVISVPNNNSFIKYNEGGVLNFPPHHMGRWSEKSLKSIALEFNVKFLDIVKEPLQTYHVEYYKNTITTAWLEHFILLRYLNKIIPLHKIISIWVRLFKKKLKGHSILVLFEK